MLIAQGTLSHVRELYGALGAGIHEPVAAEGVELGGCDDFGQLLHVCWLDIDNVEALVLNVKIPQVDAKVVAADEGLAIAIDGDAVDVICVGVRVGSTRYCGDNGIVMCEARELKVGSVSEVARR